MLYSSRTSFFVRYFTILPRYILHFTVSTCQEFTNNCEHPAFYFPVLSRIVLLILKALAIWNFQWHTTDTTVEKERNGQRKSVCYAFLTESNVFIACSAYCKSIFFTCSRSEMYSDFPTQIRLCVCVCIFL